MLIQQNPFLLGTSPVSFNSHLAIDSKGRCHHHPHITLRKKSMMRGWKVVIPTCPACDREAACKVTKRRASASDREKMYENEYKHDRIPAKGREKSSSSRTKKPAVRSAPPFNSLHHNSQMFKIDDSKGQESTKMAKQQPDVSKSSHIESLLLLSEPTTKSKVLSERRASTSNISKRSDPPLITNTSYSRHASDPLPSTSSLRRKPSTSKSYQTKRLSETSKSDPDGVKPQTTSFQRSSTAPIGRKSIESRMEQYRASVTSLRSIDPDGTSSSPVQSIPECASSSCDSDQYVYGANKSKRSKLECLLPATSAQLNLDENSNQDKSTNQSDCASATSFRSENFEEPSSPTNSLERMVKYVRHSSAPVKIMTPKRLTSFDSRKSQKSTDPEGKIASPVHQSTEMKPGDAKTPKRLTSFDSRKSKKLTDPEGKVASPVRQSTDIKPPFHRRHTTTGCSLNNSADKSLNQSGFVVSETNVAKEFTHSKSSSLDFNLDNLRQSNNTSSGIALEYSDDLSQVLPVVYEDVTYASCRETPTPKSASECYQGESSPVRATSSPMKKTQSPSVSTLQSESYPCIFVPNCQDANETGSTFSSFTESYAGHSIKSSLASNGLGASYKSVIFACGMPHVLSRSPYVKGDYTGQVTASTKLPHGLGAFVQCNGDVMEGIWQDGALVSAFGSNDTISPSESGRFSQRKTPTIRNRSKMSLDKMSAMPLPPLPADRNATRLIDPTVKLSLDAGSQSK